MSLTRLSSAFNIVSAIIALVVQMAVSFVLSSFLVQALGEAATGFTQLANNFVSYASLITLAFNSMGARFISAAWHRGHIDKAVAYYSTLIICNVALCLLLLPAAIFVISNLSSIVVMGDANPIDVALLFAFVFANFAINLFVTLFTSAMFVLNKVYIQNAINLGRNILNALLLVLVYSIFVPRVSYVALVGLLLTLFSIPVSYILKCKLVPELKFSLSAFSGHLVKRLLSSGIWNAVNQCGNVLTTGLDLLFANWFVGASPMGVLSVAKTVPSAVTTLATTLNNNIEPELVIVYAKEGVEGLAHRVLSDIRLSNLILSAPIGVICALLPYFYSLWMPSIDPILLTVLSLLTMGGLIPWSGPQAVYNVFTVMNKLKMNSITFVMGSVLNAFLVLLSLMYSDLGIFAIAGISSIISVIRNTLIIAPYSSKLLEQPWWTIHREMLVSIASVAASYVITIVLSNLICCKSWFLLIAMGVVSCILSWILLFFVTLPSSLKKGYLAFIISKLRWK